MAERLIRDLFARYEWLGWVGIGALVVLVVAIVVLEWREIAALVRLRALDGLRRKAVEVLVSDKPKDGRAILVELAALYHARPDLARPRKALEANARDILDGAEFVRLSERMLMAQLDARAKALTVASARRVALVTAVSPRALIDIAFVSYESIRLAGAIAALYGARPGFFGFWRLAGAVLGHLAITGGLALTDGFVEQLVGQGLAAKLSARLGEGLVNGLMTVRVGIAAMRVVRPLPFDTQKQPMVKDFIPELASLAKVGPKE
jgi:putative membrane protein